MHLSVRSWTAFTEFMPLTEVGRVCRKNQERSRRAKKDSRCWGWTRRRQVPWSLLQGETWFYIGSDNVQKMFALPWHAGSTLVRAFMFFSWNHADLSRFAEGFNDRQEVERRAAPEDNSGYDEFGRRKAAVGSSKAERAAAALERLKQKRKVSPQRSRSRSGSPRNDGNRRARDPKPPHAGFRPRGANHRFWPSWVLEQRFEEPWGTCWNIMEPTRTCSHGASKSGKGRSDQGQRRRKGQQMVRLELSKFAPTKGLASWNACNSCGSIASNLERNRWKRCIVSFCVILTYCHIHQSIHVFHRFHRFSSCARFTSWTNCFNGPTTPGAEKNAQIFGDESEMHHKKIRDVNNGKNYESQ